MASHTPPGRSAGCWPPPCFASRHATRPCTLPPSNLRLVLRSARLLERTGRRIAPTFAGVTLTEAVKDVYAAMPIGAVPRRHLVLADAA